MIWWLRWSSGGLWVSTERGLGRMSFEDGTWTNFLWSAVDPDDSGARFQLVGTAPPRPAPEATVKTIQIPKGVVGPGGAAHVTPAKEPRGDIGR